MQNNKEDNENYSKIKRCQGTCRDGTECLNTIFKDNLCSLHYKLRMRKELAKLLS